MKKILKDVPTSVLLLIGVFVLLFVACYSVNFVSEAAKLNVCKNKELYKNTSYYYLYDGKVTVNGNNVTVEGTGTDITEATKLLRSDSLNIAFRLFIPFEDVIYFETLDGDLGSNILDVYISYNNDKLKLGESVNALYLNTTHKDLVKKDKITLLSLPYNVIGFFEGRSTGVTVYDKLDDKAKNSLHHHAKTKGRIMVIIGSDYEIDVNEVERLKNALFDKGFTLLEAKDYVNLDESEAVSAGGGWVVSVGGMVFTLITLYILIKLWFVKRVENVAILWCHGKSKYGIFGFAAKEMSLVYGLAAIVFAVFAFLYSLFIRSMPLIYIPVAIVVAYVLLMMVAIMVYESAYRKLSMLSVISGGVE